MSEIKASRTLDTFTRGILIFAVLVVLFVPIHALLMTWQFDGLANLFSWAHLKPHLLFDFGAAAIIAIVVGARTDFPTSRGRNSHNR